MRVHYSRQTQCVQLSIVQSEKGSIRERIVKIETKTDFI